MHVKQLAWLASCPVDVTKEKTKDKRNRYQRIEDNDPNSPELILPSIDGGEYLVSLLHEAGPVESNGYGVEGLKWSEIYSWLSSTGLFVEPWELLLIRELSNVYASTYNKSNGKECPPPYKTTTLSRDEVDSKVRGIFAAISAERNNKGMK